MIENLTVRDLSARLKNGDAGIVVLDVREPWEIAIASLPGSLNIAMREIPARVAELPQDKAIAVLCHHGNRSARVAEFLVRNGFQNVYNIGGGIAAWAQDIDPTTPVY